MHDLPVLMIDERVRKLADLLLNKNIVPAKARLDALHIAIATIHHMNFLLTWNCRHMANGC